MIVAIAASPNLFAMPVNRSDRQCPLSGVKRTLSDGMKALWLIVPAAFVLGVIALILRHRVALRKIETAKGCDLVYTICRDDKGALLVYRHGGAWRRAPACVLLEEASGGE